MRIVNIRSRDILVNIRSCLYKIILGSGLRDICGYNFVIIGKQMSCLISELEGFISLFVKVNCIFLCLSITIINRDWISSLGVRGIDIRKQEFRLYLIVNFKVRTNIRCDGIGFVINCIKRRIILSRSFTGNIGVDSRYYFPRSIKGKNVSPYAGAGVSWAFAPSSYLELKLLTGACWFIGNGSLDAGLQYGIKSGLLFTIGYTFRPNIKL